MLFFLLIIKEKERFEKIYTSKKFKKVSEVLGSSFLIFCILCVINHLFYKNPKGWDLTKYKQNSLSPETVEYSKQIRGNAKGICF